MNLHDEYSNVYQKQKIVHDEYSKVTQEQKEV